MWNTDPECFKTDEIELDDIVLVQTTTSMQGGNHWLKVITKSPSPFGNCNFSGEYLNEKIKKLGGYMVGFSLQEIIAKQGQTITGLSD